MRTLFRTLCIVGVLALPTVSWSAGSRHWLSTSTTAATCADVLGPSDPGLYYTWSAFIAAGCMASGDTITFKNGTYTDWINFDNLVPSGTSVAQTVVECETALGCTLVPSGTGPGSFGNVAAVTLTNKDYVTIQNFIIDVVNGTTQMGIYFQIISPGIFTHYGMQIIGNEIRNTHSNGIGMRSQNSGTVSYDSIYVAYNNVASWGTVYTGGGPPHPYYITATNSIIEYNEAHTVNTPSQYAIQCWQNCDNTIFRYNIAYVTGTGVRGWTAGSDWHAVTNVQAYGNVFIGVGTNSGCMRFHGNLSNSFFYHNICHGFNVFMEQIYTNGPNTAKNNVCLAGWSCSMLLTQGTWTLANNFTGVATSNFTNAAGGDYSLSSTATTLINACVNVGLPYNGSAPDCGPYETWGIASGSITGNTITLTMNPIHPPILPASGLTGFIVNNGRSVTSATASGSTVTLQINGAPCTTESWSVGIDSSNATDSTLVGNQFNQPLLDATPLFLSNLCSTIDRPAAPTGMRIGKVLQEYDARD